VHAPMGILVHMWVWAYWWICGYFSMAHPRISRRRALKDDSVGGFLEDKTEAIGIHLRLLQCFAAPSEDLEINSGNQRIQNKGGCCVGRKCVSQVCVSRRMSHVPGPKSLSLSLSHIQCLSLICNVCASCAMSVSRIERGCRIERVCRIFMYIYT